MPTTEMVSLSLKAGLNPGQPEDASAKVLHETCVALSKTSGCQAVRFGTAIEDGSILRLLIDWENLDKHREFMASDRYQAFSANIKSILTGPPKIQHVDFRSTAAGGHIQVFSAPVSEIANIYFDGKVPDDYDAAMDVLAKAAQGQPGFHALSWGSTYETLEHSGVKGQAAAVTLGWDSVDAHMKFRETQAFKDAVPGLRSTSKASETQHVQVMTFQA